MAQTVALPSSAQAGADAIIQVTGLRKRYGRNGVVAVRDVSFTAPPGQVFGLLGPDGAGKTSIVQILAGVLRADGGQARVAGLDVTAQPEAVKSLIGYMPQGLGLNLYDSLTVEENIAFFRDLRQIPAVQFRANRDRLLEMTRLAPFLKRPAGQLSGGMRQKLTLICTLIHLPDILLLDEPTTGVDPISRRDFWTIIHELVTSRGVTVLLTTSYMDEAERCHRVALLHEGAIVAQGAPEELTATLPGRVLAVSGAAPEQLLPTLSAWPAAESVALFGREVHLLVRDGPEDVAAWLEAAGVREAQSREIVAGLEDVFVHHLLTRRDAAATPQSGATVVATHAELITGAAPIAAHELICRFGDFVAVDRVTLEVRAGEIFGLLGPNGAGKTTLIKMLCGLQRPSAGGATVAGYDVARQRDALRAHLGYMSQRFSLYRDLSVTGNLRLAAGLYGLARAERPQRMATLLRSLGLAAFADRLTESLPLGLRQRLALACALLHQPSVLFLDEPTSGVDPLARRQFWDLVHLLARQGGVTVLVSTHYMDEAEHCDRLGFMHQGRLIAVGSPATLQQEAEARGGPLVVVEATDFAAAFHCLRAAFPQAMLYGRRIQWQSARPQEELARAEALLHAARVPAQLRRQRLAMEETFVSFIAQAEEHHG